MSYPVIRKFENHGYHRTLGNQGIYAFPARAGMNELDAEEKHGLVWKNRYCRLLRKKLSFQSEAQARAQAKAQASPRLHLSQQPLDYQSTGRPASTGCTAMYGRPQSVCGLPGVP